MSRPSSTVLATVVSLSMLAFGCSAGDPGPTGSAAPTGSSAASESAGSSAVAPTPAPATSTRPAPARGGGPVTRVVVVSVDGLMPKALRSLGADGAPTFHRLVDQGATTLNARTERELTITLPNHTGMVTGRRVNAARGGHGVTWNDDRRDPRTVQEAAGHPVSSVFRVVDSDTRDPAVFASKTKFSLFERSWPHAVDRYTYRSSNPRLMRLVRRDLVQHRSRALSFVHLSRPDEAGHAYGWLSPEYLDAVRQVDGLLGDLVRTIRGHDRLRRHTVLVVTADHGGSGPDHEETGQYANYRVPFLVWGRTVARGADLYDLNDDYADPGRRRTRYSDPEQPVRNGDVANLVTDLLGLGAVPGSEHDAGQDLDWN